MLAAAQAASKQLPGAWRSGQSRPSGQDQVAVGLVPRTLLPGDSRAAAHLVTWPAVGTGRLLVDGDVRTARIAGVRDAAVGHAEAALQGHARCPGARGARALLIVALHLLTIHSGFLRVTTNPGFRQNETAPIR